MHGPCHVFIPLLTLAFSFVRFESASKLCDVAKEAIEAKRKLFNYAGIMPQISIPVPTPDPQVDPPAAPTLSTDELSTTEIQRDNDWSLKCDDQLNEDADKKARELADQDKFDKPTKVARQTKYGENVAMFRNIGSEYSDKATTVTNPKNKVLTKGTKPEDAIGQAIEIWFNEVHCYKFTALGATLFDLVEHFTAMIWMDMAYIGVGVGTSKKGNVYVVVRFLTVSRLPPNIANDMADFAKSIPEPNRDAIPKQACNPNSLNRNNDGFIRKPVPPEEIMETAKSQMQSLVKPESITKERNKIARIAMYICEAKPELLAIVKERLASDDRKNPKAVNMKIGEMLCTNTKYSTNEQFVTQYMHCVQSISKENNIDYFLKSTKVKGICTYKYSRKIAQHRCRRGHRSLKNVSLWLSVMRSFLLLKNAQTELEKNEGIDCRPV